MKRFDTVAKLKLAKLKEGQFVETGGYYAKGDAGAARYLIVTPQSFDGYGDHELANGNIAVLQGAGAVNVKQFGAKGDGVTDDTLAIQAALDSFAPIAGQRLVVVIPESVAEFIFTRLDVGSRTIFESLGGVLKLKDSTTTSITTQYYPINNLGHIKTTFKNLICDGNPATNQIQFTTGVADMITCVGNESKVIGCTIYNAPDSGIMFSNVLRGYCTNNYIEGASDAGIYANGDEDSLPSNNTISSNVIKNCHTVGIALKRGLNTVTVSSNVIDDCGNGITHEDFGTGLGGHPINMVITDNHISDIGFNHRTAPLPSESGLTLNRLTDSVVTGNRVSNCGGSGLDAAGAVRSIISDNYLKAYTTSPHATQAGLVLRPRLDAGDSSTTNCLDNVIKGNIVIDFDDKGLFINDALAVNTIIQGNRVKSLNNTGLRVDAGTTRTSVIGNICEAPSADFDLQVLTGTQLVIRDNLLVNDGGDYLSRAGTPVNFLTPRFVGDLALDTSNNVWYKSYGMGNTNWV